MSKSEKSNTITVKTNPSTNIYYPKDFDELKNYCNRAKPGDTIQLLNNTTYYGNLIIDSINGSKNSLIYIIGNNTSTIQGNENTKSYVIKIQHSSYVYFGLTTSSDNECGQGYNLITAQKGIYVDTCNNITIQNLNIYDIGYEGLHILYSSHCKVLNNNIHDTGNYEPEKGYGEGIYIGSAKSNWENGVPDTTNNITISYNNLYNIISECVDIKEGTQNGIISHNNMDGSKLSNDNYADSWIDIKGSNWTIENNTMNFTLKDGIQTHHIADSVEDSGFNNTFSGNSMDCIKADGEPCNGYAIYFDSTTSDESSNNKVYNNNTYSNAENGLTNIQITQSSV